MENKVFPFVKSFDHVSGKESHYLSFFLKHYIPVDRLTDIQGMGHFDELNKIFKDSEEEHKKKTVVTYFLLSGSAAEGLVVPVLHDRKTQKEIWNSDFDILRIFSNCLVAEPEFVVISGASDIGGIIIPSSHEGFVKILRKDEKDKLIYLSSSEWAERKIVSSFMENIQDEDFAIYSHGPALTTTSNLRVELDNVYAYKCSHWPSFAKNWLVRKRASHWPSTDLIRSIAKEGCHIVAIGHVKSLERDIEWRLSFSNAEKKLANDLNRFQKKAYVIFKILHFYCFNFPKIIATYHLKTTLFWVCEKQPISFWCDSNMAMCVYALLDQLINFLSCKNIPNYFIPENNMIDHVHQDFIDTTLKQVIKLRSDVFETLMSFDEKYRLSFSPYKPWRTSLTIMNNPRMKVAHDEEQLYVFSLTLSNIANIYTTMSGTSKGPIQEAIYCLEESWKYRQLMLNFDSSEDRKDASIIEHLLENINLMFAQVSMQPSFNFICALLQLLEGIIEKYKEKLTSESDKDSFSYIYSLAAILCHCKAVWDLKYDVSKQLSSQYISSLDRDKEYEKALSLFKEAVALKKVHLLDKAKLLFQFGKYDEARHDLEEIITTSDFSVFQFTNIELPTLEENVREVLMSRRMIIPLRFSGMFVCNYYLCMTYLALKKVSKAQTPLDLLFICCQEENIENPSLYQKLYEIALKKVQNAA